MMQQSADVYARTQGITAAGINAILNPVLAWLGNREMEFVPLSGGHSIIVDTAVTSVVLSFLVTLFLSFGVRRELKTCSIAVTNGLLRKGHLLSRLPGKAWALGLILGVGVAFVLTPLTFEFFHLFGIQGLPFIGFALFKAISLRYSPFSWRGW